MNKTIKRQNDILLFIKKQGKAGNHEIREFISRKYGDISRHTIIRDLENLVDNKKIEKVGSGRSVFYSAVKEAGEPKYFDDQGYFDKLPDERQIIKGFNFDVFDNLNNLIPQNEIKELRSLNREKQSHIESLSPTIYKKELERLIIDLSWKSSYIEGNTYNILETEYLLKERKEAVGHTKAEARMIINHKEAIEYIIRNKEDFKELSVKKIEDIHFLLTKDLGIERNIRRSLVGISGTNYQPLDNEFQISEVLEKTCSLVNNEKNPLVKSLILNLLIAYIQPFEDGNKRTSRITGNAILIAYNYCPQSFRSVDNIEYKKSIILFYEQNNALYFKNIFVDQFKFALREYFL